MWLSWENDVSLSSSDGQTIVAGPGARIALRPIRPEILAALERTNTSRRRRRTTDCSDSRSRRGMTDSTADHAHVDQLRLGVLDSPLALRRRQTAGDVFLQYPAPERLVAAPALEPEPRFGERPPTRRQRPCRQASETTAYVLSRFAFLRRKADKLVLESPLGHARVVLEDPRVLSLLGALSTATSLSQLATVAGDLAPADVQAFVALLQEARFDRPAANRCGKRGRARFRVLRTRGMTRLSRPGNFTTCYSIRGAAKGVPMADLAERTAWQANRRRRPSSRAPLGRGTIFTVPICNSLSEMILPWRGCKNAGARSAAMDKCR